MATHTSALSLYNAQLARFAQVKVGAKTMHAHMVAACFDDARDLTAGGNGPQGRPRKKWLRRNRPFARNMARVNLAAYRNGPGKVSPLPIGVISSRLYRSWSLHRIQKQTGQEYHMRNSAAYARFILFDSGTRKMLGRGFQSETRKRFRARNKALLDTIRIRQRRN